MTTRNTAINQWQALMTQQDVFWKRDNKTRNFAFTLLELAGNAQRAAMAGKVQGELFP